MIPFAFGDVTVTRVVEIPRSAYPTASMLPDSTPETIALVTRESPIVAVHYQDIIQATPPTDGAPSEPRWASVGAPTRRIKERFLQGMRARLPSAEVRNVSEPRFAYLVRYLIPDPHWLKRTFGRGLAFDFYSPRQSLHVGGGGRIAQEDDCYSAAGAE